MMQLLLSTGITELMAFAIPCTAKCSRCEQSWRKRKRRTSIWPPKSLANAVYKRYSHRISSSKARSLRFMILQDSPTKQCLNGRRLLRSRARGYNETPIMKRTMASPKTLAPTDFSSSPTALSNRRYCYQASAQYRTHISQSMLYSSCAHTTNFHGRPPGPFYHDYKNKTPLIAASKFSSDTGLLIYSLQETDPQIQNDQAKPQHNNSNKKPFVDLIIDMFYRWPTCFRSGRSGLRFHEGQGYGGLMVSEWLLSRWRWVGRWVGSRSVASG